MRSFLILIVICLSFNLVAMEISCEVDSKVHRIIFNYDNVLNQKADNYTSVALIEELDYQNDLKNRYFTTAMHLKRDCVGCIQIFIDKLPTENQDVPSARYLLGFKNFEVNKSPELFESYYKKDLMTGIEPIRCFAKQEDFEE